MAANTALKMAIFAAGRSQIAVAKATGLHETRLSKIIRGHVEPTAEEQLRLAHELQVGVAVLFPPASPAPAPAGASATPQQFLPLRAGVAK